MTRSARDMVRVFHDRDPYWEKRIVIEMPKHLRLRGDMLSVGYRSDKWEAQGDAYEYIHEHGSNVHLFEACEAQEGEPAPRWPTQWACLGELWHVEFTDAQTGKKTEAAISRGTLLLCDPSGRQLVCLHPTRGFYGAIWGGDMFVGPDGIEN